MTLCFLPTILRRKSSHYADETWRESSIWTISHISSAVEKAVGNIPETISCRYNPGGYVQNQQRYHGQPWGCKIRHDSRNRSSEAYTYPESQKAQKNFGIHAFLASNTVTNEYYPMLAKVLFELAVKLKKETGAHIKFINLSGGIGIPYRPDQEPNDIHGHRRRRAQGI